MRRNWALLATSAFGFLMACAPVLAHWPDQPPHQIVDLGEFAFEGGGKIPNLRMSYITYGTLNAAKDNAILFQHGFAANHHLFDHLIGPGKPLDTDKYFIICPDMLGATQTTFEHSSSPTSSGLKMQFPFYNQRDMVKAQYRLYNRETGHRSPIGCHRNLIGAGQSVQFAITYPDFMNGIFPVVGGALWGTQGYFLWPAHALDYRSLLWMGRRQLRARTLSNARQMHCQCWCPTSTQESGGI